MNLLKYVFFLLFAIACHSAYGQAQHPAWAWRLWQNVDASAIATDKNDNVYICGRVSKTAHPASVSDWQALHISKYAPNGNLVWAKGYGYGNMYVRNMKLDHYGDIYLQGFYTGIASFGSFTLNNTSTGIACFTAKVDAWGNIEWANAQSSAASGDLFTLLGIDWTGSTYTAGVYGGNLDLGSVQLNSGTFGDLYLVKYNADGSTTWAKSYELFESTSLRQVLTTADADGNSYITGDYNDSIRLGNTTLYPSPLSSGFANGSFLAKHDVDGNLVWVKQLKRADILYITTDIKGNVYATGNVTDSADLGTGPISVGSGGISFLASFDKDGNTVFAKTIRFSQMPTWEVGTAIATDPNDNIYVGGIFEDHGTLAKIDATGNMLWAFVDSLKLDEKNRGSIDGIAASPSGTVYTLSNWTTNFGELDGTYISKLGLFPANITNITTGEPVLRIYPNPATDIIKVVCGDIPPRIEIYDLSGKTVYSNTTINTEETSIDIQQLSAGIYFLSTGSPAGNAVFTKQ